MKYEEVLNFINRYDEMSSEEVYGQLKPILDSYYVKDLAEKIGYSEKQIYYISEFSKPSLKLYAKIMSSGLGDKEQKKRRKEQESFKKRQEYFREYAKNHREKYREYSHQYYQNVVKPAKEKAKSRK